MAAARERRVGASRGRSRARRRAVQALYQWQLTAQSVKEIEAQFEREQDLRETDLGYFRDLLRGVVREREALDAALAPHLHRPIEQVDPVERAILRLGAYELRARPDVPYRVVIDEAVGLARVFGAEDGHRFVNAVLDKLIPELRAAEHEAEL